MRKTLSALYLTYSALLFLSIMLVICPLVVLATTMLNKRSAKKAALFLLKVWAALFSWFSGFWIRTKNRGLVDTSKPYIYVANHGSYLDGVAVAYSMPQVFSPLGKIEMVKVPVFGWIYERVVVLIDRTSKESRDESVLRLTEEIMENTSILLFPEGTMNQTEETLAPFYDGAFRIAIETQTPILPIILQNAKTLLPRKNPLLAHPGILTVHFGTPISVTGLLPDDVTALKEQVFAQMLRMMQAQA